MENKYNTDYNHISEKLCTIKALGVEKTRWNNYNYDEHPNQQKLYCRLATRKRCVLKCEYTPNSALIEVYEQFQFKGIGDKAPHLIDSVLECIQTVYPQAEVVGEEKLIRVVF